ncbi:MAG: hypothetical protein HDKAJFGB_00782 [Anaerolineae bacterium]|nr:hypothetical protein [Anaerolineae bacterium]
MNFDFPKPHRKNVPLEDALQEIERGDFVHRVAELERVYSFKHVLVQETAYASLLRQDRRALHQCIAQNCELLFAAEVDENLALLAYHFDQAGESAKALDYWIRYGERAMQLGAYPEAIQALERALQILPGEPCAQAAQAYAQLGEIFSRRTDFARAKENYQNGLSAAIAANDAIIAARALTGIARVESQQGNHSQARALGEEALRWATNAKDDAAIARAQRQLGIAYSYEGEYALAEEYLQASLARSRAMGDLEGVGSCLNSLGVIARDLGALERAKEYFEQALALGRQLGDRYGTSIRLLNLGALAEMRGELDAAERYQHEALALSQEIGDREGIAVVACNLGMLALRRADNATARAQFCVSLGEALEIGALATAVYVIAAFAKLELARGNDEYAAELLGLAFAHPASTADIKIDFADLSKELERRLARARLEQAMARGSVLSLRAVARAMESNQAA